MLTRRARRVAARLRRQVGESFPDQTPEIPQPDPIEVSRYGYSVDDCEREWQREQLADLMPDQAAEEGGENVPNNR